ncbi:MAG: 16S rRNA (guanine(527)-N(7))-methyltransferase RsmG [Pseudonocardiales bacterium]|nr:MAG: 16S rRNA (guanine(527)-N(7))-methyltransferase RsmG [Pseudonocardiales bacterium]
MSGPTVLPDPPAQATTVFGDRLELACEFARVLASDAITRGLIGPHEVPRLWDRHLLNCAVVAELLPPDARVVDVGSGAGLPGIAFAIRRADLRVDLVEPLQRRAVFLDEVVQRLGLAATVTVVRGRAEERAVLATVAPVEWVTARAVAPLDRLVRWCLPMLQPGGTLLALKGASAATEVREHLLIMNSLGGRDIDVIECGVGVLEQPTAVVRVRRNTTARRGVKGHG